MKKNYELPPDTKLKLIAIHKITLKEYEKIITYKEWKELKRAFPACTP